MANWLNSSDIKSKLVAKLLIIIILVTQMLLLLGKSAEESSNTQKKRRITTQASPVHAPPLVVKEKYKMKRPSNGKTVVLSIDRPLQAAMKSDRARVRKISTRSHDRSRKVKTTTTVTTRCQQRH